jgi:hypothetical protein
VEANHGTLITSLPAEVTYHDRKKSVLPRKYVQKEGNLRLFVPPYLIDSVAEVLRNHGFKDLRLTFHKGEKYSLSKKLLKIWELHVRIFSDGFIDAHFEISRDFLEHLHHSTLPSLYEVFDIYKEIYPKIHIYDAGNKKWISEVISKYTLSLRAPKTVTKWRPLFYTSLILMFVGTALILKH